MSIEVTIAQLFADIELWGAGFLATVGDDGRARFVALRPTATERGGEHVLHFAHAGRTAHKNVIERPDVSIAFPPHPASDGFSLIVDGRASVDQSAEGTIEVLPTWAVLHRPAP